MNVAAAACAGVAALLAAAAAAQSDWQYRGSDATVRLVGPTAHSLHGPIDAVADLPAGDYSVHFGADARGKPRSLALAVTDGERVAIAVADAAAAESVELPLDDVVWSPPAGDDKHGFERCSFPGTDGDAQRIVAEFAAAAEADASAFGVSVRGSAEGCYRGTWDRKAAELRLERVLAGAVLVLDRTAIASDERPHTLALQASGFRIELFVDDAPMLQAFDGALLRGDVGVLQRGAPALTRLRLEAPAAMRDSSAVVARTGRAQVVVATVVSPGHFHLLELRLDRPHALLPIADNGLEPALLLPSAAPVVLRADWRGSLGRASTGEVPPSGTFASELVWPLLPALRQQVVMVRVLLVPPDGSVIAGATPALPLLL